jgi:hypothetical protein
MGRSKPPPATLSQIDVGEPAPSNLRDTAASLGDNRVEPPDQGSLTVLPDHQFGHSKRHYPPRARLGHGRQVVCFGQLLAPPADETVMAEFQATKKFLILRHFGSQHSSLEVGKDGGLPCVSEIWLLPGARP